MEGARSRPWYDSRVDEGGHPVYRSPAGTPEGQRRAEERVQYERTWRQLRFLRRLGNPLPFIVVSLSVGVITPFAMPPFGNVWVVVGTSLITVPGLVLALARLVRLPCPRCQRPLIPFPGGTKEEPEHCVHCGLPHFAPFDPDAGNDQRVKPDRDGEAFFVEGG